MSADTDALNLQPVARDFRLGAHDHAGAATVRFGSGVVRTTTRLAQRRHFVAAILGDHRRRANLILGF